MKKLLLVIMMSLAVIQIIKAADTTITELRGLEDNKGFTHLVYRLHTTSGDNNAGSENDSYYHINFADNSDTSFLSAGAFWNPTISESNYIHDLEFWNNNPNKYIYTGSECGDFECVGVLKSYDTITVNQDIFFFETMASLAVSDLNDSLIFTSVGFNIYKSADCGKNWNLIDSSNNHYLITISPYDYNILFAIDQKGYIEKSSDGAKSFVLVDSSASILWSVNQKIQFDKDSIHLYYIPITSYDANYGTNLIVSSNKGSLKSWVKKYSGEGKMFLSLDNSKFGNLYLADGNRIYFSNNYGDTFTLYQTLNSSIVGIYKKPNSDLLYAATNYDIYEILTNSIKSLKHFITAVNDDGKEIVKNFVLHQNYPNPFNPSTTISYEIPKSGLVQLKIYDVLGKEVVSLVNKVQSAGQHTVVFNSKQTNKELSSGIYLYRLKIGNNILSRKMIMLK
jgi:hypothetical protein